ncbi:N-acetyltransferase [Candidatus Contubernalis alkalaceticus]|nr:N-acetyltransferase [Candidatus Contubernalis alkalaceticus]
MNNNYTVRLEMKKDWNEVENLTREAFWNKYCPGCSEHFILHQFRNRPDFVKELDYVIEKNDRIVAHIMYCKSEIVHDNGQIIPIMTFGPVSVLPECQGKGYGSELIRFTMGKALELGCGAIVITGNPDYYHRFGFVSGHSMQIYYAAVPRDEEAPFFMVKELQSGYLSGVTGIFQDPDGYMVEDTDVEKFDVNFSPKEKKKLPGQLA